MLGYHTNNNPVTNLIKQSRINQVLVSALAISAYQITGVLNGQPQLVCGVCGVVAMVAGGRAGGREG